MNKIIKQLEYFQIKEKEISKYFLLTNDDGIYEQRESNEIKNLKLF